jgi:hypothetical protein
VFREGYVAIPAPKGIRPPNAGKGRPKGATNTMARTLKETILGTLDDAGGQDYLAEQARKNPAAFLALLGLVLPREPHADDAPPQITLNFGTTLRPPRPTIEEAEYLIQNATPKLLLSALRASTVSGRRPSE